MYWRNIRKLCTVHLLSNQKIHSFQSMRKQEVELLIESLKQEARDRVVIDLSAKVTSLNANLTCLMVFGKKYMDEDLDKRGFKAIVQDVVHLAGMPNLGDFSPSLVLLISKVSLASSRIFQRCLMSSWRRLLMNMFTLMNISKTRTLWTP